MVQANTSRPLLIEKEVIPQLTFPADDVLKRPYAKTMRDTDIRQAMRLGNIERMKVSIVFENNEGPKQVNTTIWGITKKELLLKGDIVIPLHRVRQINFFWVEAR